MTHQINQNHEITREEINNPPSLALSVVYMKCIFYVCHSLHTTRVHFPAKTNFLFLFSLVFVFIFQIASMSGVDEDIDLYGDISLHTSSSNNTLSYVEILEQLQTTKEERDKITEEYNALKLKSNKLEKECESLNKLNTVLTRNISCLFKTAQLENQRKDEEIAKLREQLERQKKV